MHIGLIGGIGPAATEFYYRNLVKADQASDGDSRMELTICHAQASDLIRNIQAGNVDAQVRIFEVLANRLSAAGAEALAVTSIAGHFCISKLEKVSPIPIIDALSGLESALIQNAYTRGAYWATRWSWRHGCSIAFERPKSLSRLAIA